MALKECATRRSRKGNCSMIPIAKSWKSAAWLLLLGMILPSVARSAPRDASAGQFPASLRSTTNLISGLGTGTSSMWTIQTPR